MDVREKMVELFYDNNVRCDQKIEGLADDVMDIIANGVTVQEWISVAEPPKEYRDEYGELIPFLVCAEGTDYPFRAMYDGNTWGDGIFAIHVKWWMPLQQPPEGE